MYSFKTQCHSNSPYNTTYTGTNEFLAIILAEWFHNLSELTEQVVPTCKQPWMHANRS